MKIVAIIIRILLGVVFLVFGLNGFLNFIHGPLPGGTAGDFLGALIHSHYVYFISGIQLIAGVLLLVNRFVPLALALLAPIIANILVFHLTMEPMGIGMALVVAIFWAILAWRFRAYFAPLFVQKAESERGHTVSHN